ncbi:MAG: hypothetical protein AAGL49_07060, partial [Pseudomonadota bacterium]
MCQKRTITGFHAHIYFEPGQSEAAERLARDADAAPLPILSQGPERSGKCVPADGLESAVTAKEPAVD